MEGYPRNSIFDPSQLPPKPPIIKAGSSPNLHLHINSHMNNSPYTSPPHWGSPNQHPPVSNMVMMSGSSPLYGTPLGIPHNLRSSTDGYSNGTLSPSSSPGTIKRSRKNLEKNQVEVLENAFANERYPSKQAKELIAAQSGLDYNKVVKWFDNRRTKARKTSDAPRYEGDNSPSLVSSSSLMSSSPSSPEATSSPSHSSTSPLFPTYNNSSSGTFLPGSSGQFNPTFSPGSNSNTNSPTPQRKLSGSINVISAKMSNFNFNDDEGNRLRSRSAGSALPLPMINTDLNFGDSRMQLYSGPQITQINRRIPRTMEENWDLSKDHRMYACEITQSRTGSELQDAATRNFEGWMMWMINKKKNKSKRMDYLGIHNAGGNTDHFRKEVGNLLNALQYSHETVLWQGDNYWLSGTIHMTNFSFRKHDDHLPTSMEKDSKEDIHMRGDCVNIEAVYESRTVGRPIQTSQATTNRMYFRIGTSSALYGKEETFTIGVKAHGNQDEGNGIPNTFEAWGDLERLRQVLETNLKHTELMAFLVFCSQFKADDSWFRTCMSQSMFGEDDTDYYAENDD